MRSKDNEFAAVKLPRCLVCEGVKAQWRRLLLSQYWEIVMMHGVTQISKRPAKKTRDSRIIPGDSKGQKVPK